MVLDEKSTFAEKNIMPRNTEVIRQWSILRELEASHGSTIRHLSNITGVTTRTIRRDLEALQEAGFPLYDQPGPSAKVWKLDSRPFKHLNETAFTLAELSALYFSRTLVECLTATPFGDDLEGVFQKLDSALGPRMRQFLDRLPSVIQVKREPTQQPHGTKQHAVIGRLLDAIMHQRQLEMKYHSMSSKREKQYRLDPYRLVYAQGGLYLFGYVPQYDQVRTFAVERIRKITPTAETFKQIEDFASAAFPHSLGIHDGKPEPVELVFTPVLAPYILERTWHTSQQLTSRQDGSLILKMDVCIDGALRGWILSFGSNVRVKSPKALLQHIAAEISRAQSHYTGQSS